MDLNKDAARHLHSNNVDTTTILKAIPIKKESLKKTLTAASKAHNPHKKH